MKNRIELLARKNKGKLIVGEFLNTFSSITGTLATDIKLLDLEKSDEIIKNYFNKFRSVQNTKDCFYKKIPNSNFDYLINILNDFSHTIKGEFVYYFNKGSDFYGVIETSSKILFKSNSYNKLIELDGDSLNIASDDLENGILIDYFEENSEWFYDLFIWGDR